MKHELTVIGTKKRMNMRTNTEMKTIWISPSGRPIAPCCNTDGHRVYLVRTPDGARCPECGRLYSIKLDMIRGKVKYIFNDQNGDGL